MTSRWQWLLRQIGRKLWVRVSIFSLAAVATALAGVFLAGYVPEGLAERIGSDSIDDILQILATSMLAVTTFSLTTMVSAYSAATSSVTPRAAKLLMDDTTAQNPLGTFIGTFVFSLVGIIALSTGAYGEGGRVILFLATIALIVLIVVTMLRWIDYLSRLGRVGETTDRVEEATLKGLQERIEYPGLGAHILADRSRIPTDAMPVFANEIGYVQYIDVAALSACTEESGAEVFVAAQVGAFANTIRPLAFVAGPGDEELHDRVRSAFTVAGDRSFDQDPRFGLCVLAEIASRALSPAVNDPGTAIDVLGRAERLLHQWAQGPRNSETQSVEFPRVWMPPLDPDDMLDDVFAPIARDGAGTLEVQIRLQKALRSLAAVDNPLVAAAARRHSRQALDRAEVALGMEHERRLVRSIAEEVAGTMRQLPS
jgi:uncharacterized membrane protein